MFDAHDKAFEFIGAACQREIYNRVASAARRASSGATRAPIELPTTSISFNPFSAMQRCTPQTDH